MERTLKYEKSFIHMYTIITSMIIIYFITSVLLNRCSKYIIQGLIFTISIYAINVIIYKLVYHNKFYIYYGVRWIQMIICLYFMLEENRFLVNSSSIIYIILCFELIIVLDFNNKMIKYSAFGLGILPLILISIYKGIAGHITFAPILFILQIITIVVGLCFIFYRLKNDYKNQFKKQENELTKANKRLDRFSAEMYIQNEILNYISSVFDMDELMELVTDSIIGAIGVDTCSLIIYDDNINTYHYKIKSIHNKNFLEPLVNILNTGKLEKFFNIINPYIDNDVKKSKYEFISSRDVGSLVIVPILNNKRTYGLLIAEHAATKMINENSIQFFQGIANQINIALINANLYTKMEEMARKDGLTCIYNRNYLQKIYRELYMDAEINNKFLSLALFDIDKFKRVNDTYGHLFGDQVLKIIADITEKHAVKNGGIVGRYGGEEFVVIFPNKNIEEVYKIMKDIHMNITKQQITHENKSINIDISTGISSYPETCKTAEDLLKRADNAMYISKANGRGRITIDNID